MCPSPSPSLAPSSSFALLISLSLFHLLSLPRSLYTTLSPVLFPRISSLALLTHCISPFLQFLTFPRETLPALRAQPSTQKTSSISADHNVLTTLCLYESGSILRVIVCSIAAFRESRQLPLISEKISLLERDSSTHVFPLSVDCWYIFLLVIFSANHKPCLTSSANHPTPDWG